MDNLKALDDHGGSNVFAVNPSSYIDAKVLAADVAESFTVPEGARFVLFSATADFYVNFNGGTAAVPSADVTDGSASELNTIHRHVTAGATHSIIAPAATIVTLSYWS